jgi:hypothetical protein
MLTTTAFDRSSSRWFGISDLIAEPEGPSFIFSTVAQRRLLVTQDPLRTLIVAAMSAGRNDGEAEIL